MCESLSNSSSLLPWIDHELDNSTMKDILPYGTQKTLIKGTYIVMQGDIVDSVYYLAKGQVKITTLTANGKEKTYWHTLAGNIIGDIPYFHQFPSNASITAVEECTVYVFNKTVFEKLLTKYPLIYQHLAKTMANKIRVLVNQIKTISFCKPIVQVCRFIYFFSLDFGKETTKGIEINQEITQTEIASINSLHRITVTKIMNQLKADNIIDYTNKSLIVKDIERLRSIATMES